MPHFPATRGNKKIIHSETTESKRQIVNEEYKASFQKKKSENAKEKSDESC